MSIVCGSDVMVRYTAQGEPLGSSQRLKGAARRLPATASGHNQEYSGLSPSAPGGVGGPAKSKDKSNHYC
jgi:hypothetical protein